MSPDRPSPRWLVLVHQLPAEPSKLRVRTWRRLQAVGAVAVKNSVYVLPHTAEAREDFEWIRGEIVALGGEALLFAAEAVDEISTGEVVDAFVAARRGDWDELRRRAAALLERLRAREEGGEDEPPDVERELRALRTRAGQIERIDFFQAGGRAEATEALAAVDRALHPEAGGERGERSRLASQDFRGRRWLTRPRPGVDRMASAWLIRRFVDPEAEFLFAERIPRGGTMVPFDMFGVDLGHHGDRCTFETLMASFGLAEPALSRIARIVHELDLAPGEAAAEPETATIGLLVAGLRATPAEDGEVLAHGMALFEALYRSFRGEAGSG